MFETLNGRLPPEDSFDWAETLGEQFREHVSDDPQHFNFRHPKHQHFAIFWKTLSGRLPHEDSSDWAETLGKRVSDEPRHFIFRPPQLLSR